MNPYQQYMYSYPHKTAYGALEDIRLTDYAERLSGRECSLYFHIPFCQSKCGYCNLFSVTGQDENRMDQYIDAMERHAGQLASVLPDSLVFSDLTLGGGTPLILSAGQLERVFGIAEKQMGFDPGERRTIVETSPAQTTKEKLAILKSYKVTRISMGVQSFCEDELKILNRSHTPDQVRSAMERIKEAEFPCVNLDLIYGIPGQTQESLLYSADEALFFEPEELFVYPLYIKKDTALFRQGVKREEAAYGMYLVLRDYLRERGYVPYSMRRFVKNGDTAGMSGCGFENTLSVGCGGRSYIDQLHFCMPYEVRQSRCREILEEYIQEKDYLAVRHGYLLSEEEQKRRFVIKNILFACGLSKNQYRQHFQTEPERDFSVLLQWVQEGLACMDGDSFRLTEHGFSLSDSLGPVLISDEVREKMLCSGISPMLEGN